MKPFAMAAAWLAIAAVSWAAVPGTAAEPEGQLGQILKRAQQFQELQITDEEEQKIGAAVSEKVRVRYGVVQDPAVHRYVSLVGTVLAQASSRPNIPYRFIVLDTDGVNAFAAPGGFIHITRGALGLMTNEAELADVIAHELIHVTHKHTIKAIQKGKLVQFSADETIGDRAVFNRLVDKTTELVLAGFGRAEEMESDREGLRLANQVGYDPKGLSAFLTRLTQRNKAASEKQGLFASHPEMQERLERIAKQIADEKLTSSATIEARYRRFVSYTAKPLAEIATIEAGSAGLTGGGTPKDPDSDKKTDDAPKKKGGFGLSSLLKPGGSERKSAEVVGSGASRGVDRERNAKGGANPAIVAVTLTAAEIAGFKKEGNLK
jgi:beta-barrel assembly-enhancing protease